MSDPNAPEGPQFQGPWQQRQPGFQPPQDPRNSTIDYNPIPPQPQPPVKSRGRWLRRVALVAPALLVGACMGSLGASGDAEGGVSALPASAPTATVTASVPGPTVTASVPGPTVTAKAAKPEPAPTVTVTVKAEQPKPEAKPEPESEPKPESKPASNMSRSQEQAVGQAESYLE